MLSNFSCSDAYSVRSDVFASRKARLYVLPLNFAAERSTLTRALSAGIEPQRPFQSKVILPASGATPSLLMTVSRSDGTGAGAPLVMAEAGSVTPLTAVVCVKPVAQTAPVASPTAPKAIQAASRRRDRRGAGESKVDMASLPFVAGSLPAGR